MTNGPARQPAAPHSADEPRGEPEPAVVSAAADGSSGTPVARGRAHRLPGLLHHAVSVQVVDPDGRWLLQRRAASKATFAGRWSNTCCTHPRPGEEPAAAVTRRLHEELGLVVTDLLDAGVFTYRAVDPASGLVEHERDRVFVAVAETAAAVADPAEVDELARLPFDEALLLVQSAAGAPWAGEVLTRAWHAREARRRGAGAGRP